MADNLYQVLERTFTAEMEAESRRNDPVYKEFMADRKERRLNRRKKRARKDKKYRDQLVAEYEKLSAAGATQKTLDNVQAMIDLFSI
jgi:hypothetical protein